MTGWSGIPGFNSAMDYVMKRSDDAAKEVLAKSGALVVSKAMRNFEGSHAKGDPHVGGDKPNIVTGYLRRSIQMDPISRVGIGQYQTRVGPGAIYGRRVELGWNGSAGYPFFGPAAEEAQDQFWDLAQKTWASFLD